MKIAIFICGLSRSYKKTSDSFLQAFSDYDYDAYMHTWKITKNSVNSVLKNKLDFVDPIADELVKCFNLKKLIIEEQIYDDIPGLLKPNNGQHPNSAICLHESIKRCMALVDPKTATEYDACVITGPDIFYHEKMIIPKVENCIYVPYINNLYEGKRILENMRKKSPHSFMDMLYDRLAFGHYNDLKVYASFADDCVSLCQDPKYYNEGNIDYLPDRAFAIYVKLIHGKIVKEIKMKHGIMRDHGIQEYSW